MARGRASEVPLSEAAESISKLRRVIVTLAWPVAAEMSLHTITQVVDMAMVGRLGSEAVAAIGLSFRPIFFVMSVFLGIGEGTTALVARFIGGDEDSLANRTIHQALLFAAPVALVLCGIMGVFSGTVMQFMGAEPEVLPLGSTYVRYMSAGLLFSFLGMVATAGLRGAGDTRTPLQVGAVANVLNVTFNYILIFGRLGFPAMGIRGAAIATSMTRGLGGIILVAFLYRGDRVLRIPRVNLFNWDFQMIRRILRVGLPAMAERLMQSVAMMLHFRMLATAGTTVIAAATLAQNIEEMSFLPAIGLSVSAAALVGQLLGAGDPDTAEQAGWQSSYLGIAFMGSMGLLFIAIPQVFLSIYGAEGELLTTGTTFLRIVGLVQVPMALGFVLSGGLRGAGDTTSVMFITTGSVWVVRLGLTGLVLFVLEWGAFAAYAALCADWTVRAVILIYLFRQGHWKHTEV